MESEHSASLEQRCIYSARGERIRVGLDSSDEAIRAAMRHPERVVKPRWLVSSPLTPAEVAILAEKRATWEADARIAFRTVVPRDVWAGNVFDYQPEHGTWTLQFTRDADHWLRVARDEAGFPYPVRLSAATVTYSLDALERAEARVHAHLAAHPELGDVGSMLSVKDNCVYVNCRSVDELPSWFAEMGPEIVGRQPRRVRVGRERA